VDERHFFQLLFGCGQRPALGRKFWFIASPVRLGVDIFTFSDHPIIDELRNLVIMSKMEERNGEVEDED
jgi:hypothetical protein